MRRARAATGCGNRSLEHRAFEVNQAQLEGLQVLLHVLTFILMKAPTYGELFHDAIKANNEVPFSVAALECEVKLTLAPLLRQFLSEIPLHLLQVSLYSTRRRLLRKEYKKKS